MDKENVNNSSEEANAGKVLSVQKFPINKTPTEIVTVYNDRAEVTRRVDASFDQKGTHEIEIEGLSSLVDKNSVRVAGGSGNAVILEVSVTSKWITSSNPENKTRAQELDSEKKSLEKLLKRQEEALARVEKEANWLNEWSNNALNKKTGEKENTNVSLSPESLKEVSNFMGFYDEQLSKFDDRRAEINSKIEELKKKIADIRNESNQLNVGAVSNEVRVVVVSLYVPEKTEVSLQLSYLITNARWSPSYDCRVASATNQMQLSYYASIQNSTGEDWTDIDLILSTATPSAGGSPPKLPTMKVQFYTEPVYDYSAKRNMDESLMMVQSVAFAQPQMEDKKKARREMERRESVPKAPPVSVLTAKAASGTSSTTFSIPRKVTIQADNKPHKVTITLVNDLKPRFTYSTIPSRTLLAYLKVSAQNTTADFPFLAGPINIFMDANFVSSSEMKTVNPGEEFALFLGTDASIKVEYKPVKKLTEGGGMLSKSKTQKVQCCTVIKNTKKIDVSVVVYDQVPLSSDAKIKVTIVEPNLKDTKQNIKLNEFNNLEWRFVVPAGTKTEVPLTYEIEWPKDKEIDTTEELNE